MFERPYSDVAPPKSHERADKRIRTVEAKADRLDKCELLTLASRISSLRAVIYYTCTKEYPLTMVAEFAYLGAVEQDTRNPPAARVRLDRHERKSRAT